MARTPGFWKNWSSVTGGGQDWILDEMLLKPGLIWVGSMSLGDATGAGRKSADDARNAFRILDKATLNGTKAAADPAFNLACHYLAFRLNVVSGSISTRTPTWPRQSAQYYLEKSGYNGTTIIKKPGYATQMNALASYIDNYNNDQLDPRSAVAGHHARYAPPCTALGMRFRPALRLTKSAEGRKGAPGE